MIYFLVTTSVFNACEIRKEQYSRGITKLKNVLRSTNLSDYKIIVVENNGARKTYLDDLGCEIYYSDNNKLQTENKGYKELKDVVECIKHYNINDNDFIVKMTGRYILQQGSKFIDQLTKINKTRYECIIRYGSFYRPVNYHYVDDCITGLIGMRCSHIKRIAFPAEDAAVEREWARATKLIDPKRVCKLRRLGIYICPRSNRYFLV